MSLKQKRSKCRSCDSIRAYFSDADEYDCVKALKLCLEVDPRLAELIRNEKKTATIAEVKMIATSIQEAYASVRRQIAENNFPSPTNATELIGLVSTLHKRVFEVTNLSFAGQIRQEEVAVGLGVNQFEGVQFKKINEALVGLFDGTLGSIDLVGCDEHKFLRFCARFLEEFFAIHPFLDGNGRIGRLCLYVFAQATRFKFIPFGFDDKTSEEYETALEYAHRHRSILLPGEPPRMAKPEDHDFRPKSAYSFLVKWLAKHLDRNVPTQPVEEKPTWIEDVEPSS